MGSFKGTLLSFRVISLAEIEFLICVLFLIKFMVVVLVGNSEVYSFVLISGVNYIRAVLRGGR